MLRSGVKPCEDMAMSDSEVDLDRLFEDGQEIDAALKEAARDARRLDRKSVV